VPLQPRQVALLTVSLLGFALEERAMVSSPTAVHGDAAVDLRTAIAQPTSSFSRHKAAIASSRTSVAPMSSALSRMPASGPASSDRTWSRWLGEGSSRARAVVWLAHAHESRTSHRGRGPAGISGLPKSEAE
jgi:hypothetical protein